MESMQEMKVGKQLNETPSSGKMVIPFVKG